MHPRQIISGKVQKMSLTEKISLTVKVPALLRDIFLAPILTLYGIPLCEIWGQKLIFFSPYFSIIKTYVVRFQQNCLYKAILLKSSSTY